MKCKLKYLALKIHISFYISILFIDIHKQGLMVINNKILYHKIKSFLKLLKPGHSQLIPYTSKGRQLGWRAWHRLLLVRFPQGSRGRYTGSRHVSDVRVCLHVLAEGGRVSVSLAATDGSARIWSLERKICLRSISA